MKKNKKSGIHIKASKQGTLRKALHAKEGETIPVSDLQKAKHSKNPAMRKKANFALNARKWKKGGKKKVGRY